MTGNETQLEDAVETGDHVPSELAREQGFGGDDPRPVMVEDVSDPTGLSEPRPELDRIDPEGAPPETATLLDGTVVRFKHLKGRELFALLRIITRGGSYMLQRLNLNPAGQSEQQFIANLIALITFAIPEADEETLEFVRVMVEPDAATVDESLQGRRREEALKAARTAARDHLRELLENPELDDLMDIVVGVIRREGPDIMALGKRLVAVIPALGPIAEEAGRRAENQRTDSSEASPERST